MSNPYSTHSHPTVNSYVPSTPSVYQPTICNEYSYSPGAQITTHKPPVTPVVPAAPIQAPKVIPSTPIKPKSTPTLSPKAFDSNVLNNLAIALQLLIVSNLLNSPISESLPLRNAQQKIEFENIPENPHTIYPSNELSQYPATQNYQSYFETTPYESNSPSYPNANYLGSSTNLGQLSSVPPAPRQGLKLQSPYDALATGFAEHLPFEHNKRDFQSPYAAILAADNSKDLFSMDFY